MITISINRYNRLLKIWIIGGILLTSTASFSQISITKQDYYPLLAPGGSHYVVVPSPWITTMNIGLKGGPNIYNFDSMTFSLPIVANNYLVDSIPSLKSRFPSGTIVFGTTPDSIIGSPVFQFINDTLFQVGRAALINQISLKYLQPYVITMAFPITYSQKYSRTSQSYDTTYDANWSITSAKQSTWPESTSVDGYGKLKILGHEYDCLRMKIEHKYVPVLEIVFFTREGISIDINLSVSQSDAGLVSIEDCMVSLSKNLMNALSIKSMKSNANHPRGSIEFLHSDSEIRYAISEKQGTANHQIRLAVYDMHGRKIAILTDKNQKDGALYPTFRRSEGAIL